MAYGNPSGSGYGTGTGTSRPRNLPDNITDPRDIDRPGIVSRFGSDLAAITRNLFPALWTIGSAVPRDIGRTLTGDIMDEGSSTVDDVLAPMGESFLNTLSLTNPLKWGEHAKEFSDNPGFFAIEHVGNVALAGAAVSAPLRAGARAAAQVPKKAAPGRPRLEQIKKIEEAGGPGAGLAKSARVSRDVVSHPYLTAGRKTLDARVPKLTALSGGGVRPLSELERNASLRETFRQVREGSPYNEWTPQQKDAAQLRTLRGERDTLRSELEGLPPEERVGSELAESLARTERSLADLESRHAGDLEALEQTRLTPLRSDEMTPMASALRDVADSSTGQWFGNFVGATPRAAKRLIRDLNDDTTQTSMEIMAQRDPVARRSVATRNLELLRREMPDEMAAAGIELPPKAKLGAMDDATLLSNLEKVRDTPQLLENLPNLQKTIDISILDTFERVNNLPEGALRNRLYDDLTLTPRLAETVRSVNREARARNIDGVEGATQTQRVLEETLGESYRLSEEQVDLDLAAMPETVQRSYHRAAEQLKREAAERDLTLAERGLSDPDAWALRVERVGDRFKAMDPEVNPELKIAPSSDQAKQLRSAGRKVKALRKTANRLAESARKKQWHERGGVSDSYRAMRRQILNLSRELDAAKLPGEVAEPLLGELQGLVDKLNADMISAGYELPGNLTTAHDRLLRTGNMADPEGAQLAHEMVRDTPGVKRGAMTEAARSAQGKGRPFEDRLLRDQTRAQEGIRRFERATEQLTKAEEAFAAFERQMQQSLDAAPAVARPYLEVSRGMAQLDGRLRELGLEQLADDLDLTGLPQTIEAMNKAGVSPVFLRRMEAREGMVGQRAASEQAPRVATMSSQRRRTQTDMELQRDLDRVKAETDIELASRVMVEETVNTIHERFGRTMDELGEVLIEQGRINRNGWRDLKHHQREKLLTDELGYNAFLPEQIFTFRGRRTPQDSTRRVWIPKKLNESLIRYQKDNAFESAIKNFVNPATATWKSFVLALRPAWHVNNIVGNAVMSLLKGRVTPGDYLDLMRPGGEAHTMLRRYKLGWDMEEFGLSREQASMLFEGGLSRDLAPHQSRRVRLTEGLVERESLKRVLDSQMSQTAGKWQQKGQRLTHASFRTNAMFDNLHRATVYLSEMRQGGSPKSGLIAAREALGDYTKMTPFEKTYVRTAFPFYAWMRHITTLTARMLRPDDISRLAIMSNVTQVLTDRDSADAMLPEYMEGDIKVPFTDDTYFSMSGMNPFSGVFDPFIHNDRISSKGLLTNANPAIQFGVERRTGVDSFTGRPFSRPVPRFDDLGREIPTAPPLGEHLFATFAPPQAELIRNIGREAVGSPRARYATGDPVLFEDARSPDLLAGITGFFGAPTRKPDLEDIQERREAAIDRGARQLERYQQQVEEYEREREARSLPEKVIPFYGN